MLSRLDKIIDGWFFERKDKLIYQLYYKIILLRYMSEWVYHIILSKFTAATCDTIIK